MYCKLFASLYQGTLRGMSNEILVFTNLLAHSDKDGYVDKHFRAIADETGLAVDQVTAAILVLESPDAESRSPDSDGRRIIRGSDHRAWGWYIVNYLRYRTIANDEDRREQNRLAQERWREKHGVSNGNGKVSKPKRRQASLSGDKKIVSSVQGEGKGKGKETKQAVDFFAFPSDLDESYRLPLREWWDYKIQRKDKYTAIGWQKLITRQRQFASVQVVASVNKSMENNWKGLFTEDVTDEEIAAATPPQPPSEPEPEIDLMANLQANIAKRLAREAAENQEPPPPEDDGTVWS